ESRSGSVRIEVVDARFSMPRDRRGRFFDHLHAAPRAAGYAPLNALAARRRGMEDPVSPGHHRAAGYLRPNSMLALQGITKVFDGRTVLSDINLTVAKGATHALIGSSGSGKTTLLRITLGLIPFEKGYVKINDQALLSFSPVEWADRIGYVPQEGGLFPHLTGRHNVSLVPRLRRWDKSRVSARMEELRRLVDLE